MKKTLLFLIMLCAFSASAAIIEPVKIYGKIISYDSKNVVLVQNNGKRVKVSKDSILKDFKKFKTGHCVHAELDNKQLAEAASSQKKGKL